jgi:hypothetical protein
MAASNPGRKFYWFEHQFDNFFGQRNYFFEQQDYLFGQQISLAKAADFIGRGSNFCWNERQIFLMKQFFLWDRHYFSNISNLHIWDWWIFHLKIIFKDECIFFIFSKHSQIQIFGWKNFLEMIAFLRAEIFQNMIRKCPEILKIFSKNASFIKKI